MAPKLTQENLLYKDQEESEIEDDDIEGLMSDPSLVVQEPSGGYVCMNYLGDRQCGLPAAVKVIHGGLFGEMPPITLCKHCSKLLKIVPLTKESSQKVSHILQKITTLANKLDVNGLHSEANILDVILKKRDR